MYDRPIFVMGCPRSGATLVGSWIGSIPSICYLGEYFGFVHSLQTLPESYARLRPPYQDEYLGLVRDVTCNFASKLAQRAGAEEFCDSTPWNVLVADELAHLYPKARFVLMLRHYSGVIQSLEGSWSRGYAWAGDTWDMRALLWEALNRSVSRHLADNLTVVSFDYLCAKPDETLRTLVNVLEGLGLKASEADYSVFATSHVSGGSGPTLATATQASLVEWSPRPSFDAAAWRDKVRVSSDVCTLLLETDATLRADFQDPRMYSSPSNWSNNLLKTEDA